VVSMSSAPTASIYATERVKSPAWERPTAGASPSRSACPPEKITRPSRRPPRSP